MAAPHFMGFLTALYTYMHYLLDQRISFAIATFEANRKCPRSLLAINNIKITYDKLKTVKFVFSTFDLFNHLKIIS